MQLPETLSDVSPDWGCRWTPQGQDGGGERRRGMRVEVGDDVDKECLVSKVESWAGGDRHHPGALGGSDGVRR